MHFFALVVELGSHLTHLLALSGSHLLHLRVDLQLPLFELFILLFKIDESSAQCLDGGRLGVRLAKLVVLDHLVEELSELAVSS